MSLLRVAALADSVARNNPHDWYVVAGMDDLGTWRRLRRLDMATGTPVIACLLEGLVAGVIAMMVGITDFEILPW